MKLIKNLEKNRWLIWIIIGIISGLAYLVAYDYYSFRASHREITSEVKYQSSLKNISENEFIGTIWLPRSLDGYSLWDAILDFNTTKKNDPKHLHYDYYFSSDSQEREIGYWQIINNKIILTSTNVITFSSDITEITRDPSDNKNILVNFRNKEPVKFSKE